MRWKDIKIGNKIMLCFMIPIVMMAGIGLWTFKVSEETARKSELVKDESVAFVLMAEQMTKNVIQIQQWLTDISATRGQDGLDDGFDEAEFSFQSFLAGLDLFKTKFQEENEEEKLQELQEIKMQLEAYYEMGKKMADAYVQGGPEWGNKLMENFNDSALEVADAMNSFEQEQFDNMVTILEEIEMSVERLKRGTLIAGLASFIIVLAFGLFLTRSVTGPLIRARNIAQHLAEGDLSVPIEEGSRDETGQLLSSIKFMVGNLREFAEKVIHATSTVASSSEETSTTISQLSAGFDQQSREIEQSATAATEMSQTVVDVAKSASDAARAAQESVTYAGEGEETVKATLSGMLDISKAVDKTAKTIGMLGDSSQQIGNIITVIEDIADQTNLLALNAAIEAARAGEQGRGFSVVAEEVRKLAEKTGKATSEISAMITKIQSDTESSIKSMNDGKSKADDGVKLAEDAKMSLNKIVQSSEGCEQMIQTIAVATEEQSVVIDQVSANMENMANVSKISQESILNIDTATNELSTLANELKSLTAWFKTS